MLFKSKDIDYEMFCDVGDLRTRGIIFISSGIERIKQKAKKHGKMTSVMRGCFETLNKPYYNLRSEELKWNTERKLS